MPRRRELRVTDYSALRPGRAYEMRVLDVRTSENALRVLMGHTSRQQAGREQTLRFPLPVRPTGPLSSLLRACGADVAVGAVINSRDLVGKSVKARFRVSAQGELEPDRFESLAKEASHEPDA